MNDIPEGSGPYSDDEDSSTPGSEESNWAVPDSGRSVLGEPPPETDAPGAKSMSEHPSSLSSDKISERPEAVDDDSKALSAAVSQARKRLGDMVGEGNRKIAELKSASTTLDEAVDRLEREVQTTHAVLERNESLAQQASRLLGEGQKLEELQDELEEQITESDERIAAATARVEELRDLRVEVEEKNAGLEDQIHEEQEKLAGERTKGEQLEARTEELQEENREIESRVARLNEKLDRLEQLRGHFLDELDSVQGVLSETMAMPAASTRVTRPRAAPTSPSSPPSGGDVLDD